MPPSSARVAAGERAPPRDQLRQPLELLAADRRLDVGHAVVEADVGILLERPPRREPWRTVSGTLMPCWRHRRNWRSQSALRGREHAAVAGGDRPCAGGTRSTRCRRAACRSSPTARPGRSRCRWRRRRPRSPAGRGARPIGRMRGEVARHAHLVHARGSPASAAGDRRLDRGRDRCCRSPGRCRRTPASRRSSGSRWRWR